MSNGGARTPRAGFVALLSNPWHPNNSQATDRSKLATDQQPATQPNPATKRSPANRQTSRKHPNEHNGRLYTEPTSRRRGPSCDPAAVPIRPRAPDAAPSHGLTSSRGDTLAATRGAFSCGRLAARATLFLVRCRPLLTSSEAQPSATDHRCSESPLQRIPLTSKQAGPLRWPCTKEASQDSQLASSRRPARETAPNDKNLLEASWPQWVPCSRRGLVQAANPNSLASSV